MIRKFLEEHKWLSLAFIVSVFLILKNSSIPYLIEPLSIIRVFFDKPKRIFWVEASKVVDIFTTAYVTSLIFYYFIDYVPAQKNKEKAEEIIKPYLVLISRYIAELIALIEYLISKQHLDSSDTIENLDQIRIEDEEIYCHRICYEDGTEIENNTYPYNVLRDCDKLRQLIWDNCKKICAIPAFNCCGDSLIQIISEIQLSDFLRILPDNNPLSILGKNVKYHGIGNGFLNFKDIHVRFQEITTCKYSFKMTEITQDELIEYQNNFAEAIKQYPALLELLQQIKMDKKKVLEDTNE